jgi:hypothetical protein
MNNILRPITKSHATTLRVSTGQPMRRECWEAVTTDGEWAFERIEEPGTPWIVVHYPRTDRAETVTTMFGTLKSARQAVERGIDNWLPSVQAAQHARGGHDLVESFYGCRACNERRWARA